MVGPKLADLIIEWHKDEIVWYGAKDRIPTFLMWAEDKQRGQGHSLKELPSNYEAASFLWASEWLLPDCSNH